MKNKVKSKQTCNWQDINNPKQVVKDYVEEIHSEDYYIKWLFKNQLWYDFHQQLLNKYKALYNDRTRT